MPAAIRVPRQRAEQSSKVLKRTGVGLGFSLVPGRDRARRVFLFPFCVSFISWEPVRYFGPGLCLLIRVAECV
ncbi:hypothetical protein SK128_011486 [Halocaridina rubra]|uniref:Uncharacterized protein n=1 Tax=Halocaridina rubra TaxID=373956 RepID=A0AAN8ZQA0_HALRR